MNVLSNGRLAICNSPEREARMLHGDRVMGIPDLIKKIVDMYQDGLATVGESDWMEQNVPLDPCVVCGGREEWETTPYCDLCSGDGYLYSCLRDEEFECPACDGVGVFAVKNKRGDCHRCCCGWESPDNARLTDIYGCRKEFLAMVSPCRVAYAGHGRFVWESDDGGYGLIAGIKIGRSKRSAQDESR